MAVGIIDNAASDQIINQAQRVVDMWPTAFGQVPDVMTLDKWLNEI